MTKSRATWYTLDYMNGAICREKWVPWLSILMMCWRVAYKAMVVTVRYDNMAVVVKLEYKRGSQCAGSSSSGVIFCERTGIWKKYKTVVLFTWH